MARHQLRSHLLYPQVDWEVLDRVLKGLKEVGQRHGKTPTEVALNWVMARCVFIVTTDVIISSV